jgi:hypothetical protein
MTQEWWAETLGVSRPTQGIPLGEEGGNSPVPRVPDTAGGSLDRRWNQAGSAASAMLVASRAPASMASQLNSSHSARPAPPFAKAAAASR